MGILSGICTQLDPNFDPWGATIPFAEKISSGAGGLGLQGWISEGGDMARLLFRLPGRLESVITDAQRGDLTVKAALAPDNARALRRIEQSINRVMWTVAAAGLFIGGLILRVAEGPNLLNTGLLLAAAAAFLWGPHPQVRPRTRPSASNIVTSSNRKNRLAEQQSRMYTAVDCQDMRGREEIERWKA